MAFYIALREFTSTRHGNVSPGDPIEVDAPLAAQWIAAGMIEELPGNGAGSAAGRVTSPSSQAGPASPDGSVITYETKPLASRPTPHSERLPGRAASTDAMATGGGATTQKSKPRATKGGRKTRARRGTSD